MRHDQVLTTERPSHAVRSIAGAFLTGLSLFACSTDSGVAPPPAAPVDWHAIDMPPYSDAGPTGPTPRERAVAQAYTAALGAPDLAQIGPMLDPNVRFAFPGLPDARGRDAVVKAHASFFGAFDQRAVATSRIWRTESQQTVEWTMTGVQARPWMGVAPTNKPVAFKGITLLWTKDDGNITEIHTYVNVATVKAELGIGSKELIAFPPPPMPTGQPQVLDQGNTPEEKTNVIAVRSALDGFEKSETDYLAALNDDVEVDMLARAPTHGKDEARAYFKAMHHAIGQLDTTVENAWGIGPYVVVEYSIAGEQQTPIEGIPVQADRVVRLRSVEIAEMRGGKIARVWRYDNPSQILGS